MNKDFNFICNSKPITITASVEKSNQSYMVYANEFRPNNCLAYPDETDFKRDTDFMVKAFEQTSMNKNEDYIYPIVAICQKHIQEYGRIVDNDLFIYIDQMTLILKEVFKSQGKTLTLVEGHKIWNLSKDTLFNVFADNIWVDKRHYLGFGASELVPHSSVVTQF